eukprot:TRINITY_DN2695_c0_g1_i1.p1 TRINITY_DN2695_c0_g1~~TRINITY_DN2695_c0_g1_i1.p1  ORF type:complete len:618 (+),score=84.29 TRINITY_DN2695_c0_g1_i1:110-1963(+)
MTHVRTHNVLPDLQPTKPPRHPPSPHELVGPKVVVRQPHPSAAGAVGVTLPTIPKVQPPAGRPNDKKAPRATHMYRPAAETTSADTVTDPQQPHPTTADSEEGLTASQRQLSASASSNSSMTVKAPETTKMAPRARRMWLRENEEKQTMELEELRTILSRFGTQALPSHVYSWTGTDSDADDPMVQIRAEHEREKERKWQSQLLEARANVLAEEEEHRTQIDVHESHAWETLYRTCAEEAVNIRMCELQADIDKRKQQQAEENAREEKEEIDLEAAIQAKHAALQLKWTVGDEHWKRVAVADEEATEMKNMMHDFDEGLISCTVNEQTRLVQQEARTERGRLMERRRMREKQRREDKERAEKEEITRQQQERIIKETDEREARREKFLLLEFGRNQQENRARVASRNLAIKHKNSAARQHDQWQKQQREVIQSETAPNPYLQEQQIKALTNVLHRQEAQLQMSPEELRKQRESPTPPPFGTTENLDVVFLTQELDYVGAPLNGLAELKTAAIGAMEDPEYALALRKQQEALHDEKRKQEEAVQQKKDEVKALEDAQQAEKEQKELEEQRKKEREEFMKKVRDLQARVELCAKPYYPKDELFPPSTTPKRAQSKDTVE